MGYSKSDMKYKKLSECAVYSSLRTTNITEATYVSTENMLPNKGGVGLSETIPDAKSASKYEVDDILLSNIRPYFKKIWYASYGGSCSNDVLVIKAINGYAPKFLYYVLSDNNFFNYATVTAKGTKMPRGSKDAIMKYLVPDVEVDVQLRIASILSSYDELIENNNRRIKILEQMAENLYKEWFVRFRFPGHEQAEFENGIPKGWEIRRFSDNIAKITAGGDRPEVYSPYKSDICTVPIFSNGTDDYGLYGYTNHPKIYEESVTVSARGTVGYVCLREEPYVPIVRLLSLVPVDKEISAKFIYYALKTDCIEGNGTSQQQMTVPMFGRKKILIPDGKLIAKFTAIVDDLFSLRRNHMIANQNLTKQRDILLPRLMSGKLEV